MFEQQKKSIKGRSLVKTRGAKVWVFDNPDDVEPELIWRPYPWNVLKDDVTAVIGLIFLLSAAPFMGVLIGCGELSWAIIWRLYTGLKLQWIKTNIMAVAEKVGNKILVDPRNYNYIPHIFFLMLWAPSLFLWAAYRHSNYGFEWSTFFIYHFLRIGPKFRFFAHIQVLVHKEGHDRKGIFKGPFRALNYACQWFIGPFYGQVPMNYETAHTKIHHRYDNGLDDTHTNLDLDRTKPWSLVVYIPRFAAYWSGISPTFFFIKKKEWSLAIRQGLGLGFFYACMAACCQWNLTFGLGYYLFPHLEAIIFFAGISYIWHAWMDPEEPDNDYVNSVTILKGHDNIYNEDYHVVHHVAPHVHWKDYPKHYEENKEKYAASHATIFEDCEEGEMIFWLITKQWRKFAEHFVDLNGKLTVEEKEALLLERLRAVLSRNNIPEDESVKTK